MEGGEEKTAPLETLQETAERTAQEDAAKSGGPERPIDPADLGQQWIMTFKQSPSVFEFVNLIQTDMLNFPQNYDSEVHGVETMAKLFPMLNDDDYPSIAKWRNKAAGATFYAARSLKQLRYEKDKFQAKGQGPKRDDIFKKISDFILDIREAEKAYDSKQGWGRKEKPPQVRKPPKPVKKVKSRYEREHTYSPEEPDSELEGIEMRPPSKRGAPRVDYREQSLSQSVAREQEPAKPKTAKQYHQELDKINKRIQAGETVDRLQHQTAKKNFHKARLSEKSVYTDSSSNRYNARQYIDYETRKVDEKHRHKAKNVLLAVEHSL